MFFAETLGPAITRRIGAGMLEHLQQKLAGHGSASTEELRTALLEFIQAHRLPLSTDAAIQYLITQGYIARQDAATFQVAA